MPNRPTIFVVITNYQMEEPWSVRLRKLGSDVRVMHMDSGLSPEIDREPDLIVVDLLSIVDLSLIERHLAAFQSPMPMPVVALCANPECARLASRFYVHGISGVQLRIDDVVSELRTHLKSKHRSGSKRRVDVHAPSVAPPHVSTVVNPSHTHTRT